MKVRVCYEEIEGIYECEDMTEAMEQFLSEHEDANAEDLTITELGTFYDRNR